MMQKGPEHRTGWHAKSEVEGVPFEVQAEHSTRRRLPSPHEMSRQLVRGRPGGLVEEPVYRWAVIAGRRRVCTLEQDRGANFVAGSISFPLLGIVDAAAAAVMRLAPHLIVARSDQADANKGPSGPLRAGS